RGGINQLYCFLSKVKRTPVVRLSLSLRCQITSPKAAYEVMVWPLSTCSLQGLPSRLANSGMVGIRLSTSGQPNWLAKLFRTSVVTELVLTSTRLVWCDFSR